MDTQAERTRALQERTRARGEDMLALVRELEEKLDKLEPLEVRLDGLLAEQDKAFATSKEFTQNVSKIKYSTEFQFRQDMMIQKRQKWMSDVRSALETQDLADEIADSHSFLNGFMNLEDSD